MRALCVFCIVERRCLEGKVRGGGTEAQMLVLWRQAFNSLGDDEQLGSSFLLAQLFSRPPLRSPAPSRKPAIRAWIENLTTVADR